MTDKRPSGRHNPRNRLTDAEAPTVRNWIFGSAAAALLATGLPLDDDPQLAKAATIVLAAIFVTGAITVRRPFGLAHSCRRSSRRVHATDQHPFGTLVEPSPHSLPRH